MFLAWVPAMTASGSNFFAGTCHADLLAWMTTHQITCTLAITQHNVGMMDRIDALIDEWQDRRPDLDFTSHQVVARILRATHFLQARLDQIAAAYGLSHTGDLEVLADLDRAGSPYERTPSELAEALLVTTGGMTVRLNRLQAAGLVERRPNPRDGRGVLVRLTLVGQELVRDALPRLLETQTASVQPMNPGARDDLAGLLRDLLIALGDTPAFRPAIVVNRRDA